MNSVDKARLIAYVQDNVKASLLPTLFPERMTVWESLQGTNELSDFVHSAADDYVRFYDQHSKGKEKYADLYLT